MLKKRNLIFLSLLILGVFLISGCWLIFTPTYTITYDGNGYTGGSVPTDSTVYKENDTVTVLDKGDLVKTGYTFAGWNTAADGSGTDHAVGSTFIMGASDVTLYGKWATNTYTVTFNSQGGNTVSSQTVEHGGLVNRPTAPTKTGYTFGGWYKESGCTNAWDFATDTVTTNVTLYAKWNINTYTVTYSDNGSTGGSVPTGPSSYEYGTLVTVLGNTGSLVKTGYTFAGWNTQADGSGTDQAEGSTFTMGASNVTLYVKWTPLYALRDTGPAGGLIFYVKEGGYSDGWMYLEAAPSDQDYAGDYTPEWGCSGTLIDGADGTAVGTGEQNTIDILAGCATVGIAADICANLSLGGYSDWFLPSKDELNLMYTNLKVAGVGDFANSNYWSSSEFSATFAWPQDFNGGNQTINTKDCSGWVRAVRAF